MTEVAGGQAVALPPLPYHRLLRALPGYRWWKPLVALLITGVLWLIFTTVVVLIGVIIAVGAGRISFDTVQGATSGLLKLFGVVDAGDPL